jgi:hypothetical protein
VRERGREREREREVFRVRYVHTNVAHRDGWKKSKSCRDREGGEQEKIGGMGTAGGEHAAYTEWFFEACRRIFD